MANLSKNPPTFLTEASVMAIELSAALEAQEVKKMSPRARFAQIQEARAEGKEWESVYENIKSIVDPMDVMTDTQVFGVEIPWNFWR
jgi:hypothetical protein